MKVNTIYETSIGEDMFEYFGLYEGMDQKHIHFIKEEGMCEVSVTLHDEEGYADQYYAGITFEIDFPKTTYKVKTEPFHCNSPMGITFFYNIGWYIDEREEEEEED